VVSLLIAIDACTRESGCLWIAPEVDRELPTDDRGVVRRDVADALTWEAVTLAPGDALVIPGSAPHWSGSNRTERPRRVLVASYAERGRGYSRAVYYAARQLRMEESTARDGRFRISTHADFAGTEVPPDVRTTDHCTHP
jgi:ectoine hydroxylase-related dioxygenase (phytanoyl-CoA dioxygenase family)